MSKIHVKMESLQQKDFKHNQVGVLKQDVVSIHKKKKQIQIIQKAITHSGFFNTSK